MSGRVYSRKIEMLAYIQAGYIPRELEQDAMLACEEPPPLWRVLARRRWERAVERLMRALVGSGLR